MLNLTTSRVRGSLSGFHPFLFPLPLPRVCSVPGVVPAEEEAQQGVCVCVVTVESVCCPGPHLCPSITLSTCIFLCLSTGSLRAQRPCVCDYTRLVQAQPAPTLPVDNTHIWRSLSFFAAVHPAYTRQLSGHHRLHTPFIDHPLWDLCRRLPPS